MANRAVFIDRDGTINVNFGYISNPDDFKIYPGVKEGIKALKDKGFKIVIITNQSGLARGYYSEEDLDKIHQKMKNELTEDVIDAIYYCPHHPDWGCDCRKPNTGLLDKAIKDLKIDPDNSFLIGDRMLDVEAGHKKKCKTVLVPENKEKVDIEMQESDVEPDFVCSDFYSGVEWILKNM